MTNNLKLMVYTASLSPTSYIPVPNVHSIKTRFPAFDHIHVLDIQLSISGAIIIDRIYRELSVETSYQGTNDIACL